jgi:hypothetical protein
MCACQAKTGEFCGGGKPEGCEHQITKERRRRSRSAIDARHSCPMIVLRLVVRSC